MISGENKIVNDIYKDGNTYFSYKKSYPLILGFREVEGIEIAKETKPEEKLKINLDKITILEHETKPPGRYNPSSLVKLMKEVGVGRPSTYSGVISGLVGYGYLVNNGGALQPTPIAKEVNDLLLSHFDDIVDEQYTAKMEDTLDDIELGKTNSKKFLKDF